MKFELEILNGQNLVLSLPGRFTIGKDDLTLDEVLHIPSAEVLLEKLTGYRFHINQVG